MTTRSGGCLCGAVKFVTEDAETDHHACHWRHVPPLVGRSVLGANARNVVFQGTESLARYQSLAWAGTGILQDLWIHVVLLSQADRDFRDERWRLRRPFAVSPRGGDFIDKKPAGYAFEGSHPRLTEAETFAKFAAR